MKRAFFFLLGAMMVLTSARCTPKDNGEGDTPVNPVSGDVAPSPKAFDGVKRASTTYQLLVYTFADSNGDGVGDFKGIQNHLDYLDGLGVTALWLSPAHPTNSYHAYDVNDYYALNPKFGTEQDFKDLIDAAHAKGIKIYMDYVLNHSGKGNAWFQQAVASSDSPYRDYYFICSDPKNEYKNFPMLKGTSYNEGEWKPITGGSPTFTVTKTDEAAYTGSSSWELWTWVGSAAGKALKFKEGEGGTLSLVLEVSGNTGMLLRYGNWERKYGAQAGQGSLSEGATVNLVPDGADMSFNGNGRYKVEVSGLLSASQLYYMGAFDQSMPDLNYGDVATCENSPAFQDIAGSADKWLTMGVDGFRLDAVKHICGGIASYNNAANIILLDKWYQRCNAKYKELGHSDNIFMVGEVWDNHSMEKSYYQGLTSCFEFKYGELLSAALNNQTAANYVSSVMGFEADHKGVRPDAQTSYFLSNHDQDRWAEWVGKDDAKEKQSAAMLLTGPGRPFVYMGEELGYWGNNNTHGDAGRRQPMAWDASLSDLCRYGLDGQYKSDSDMDKNMVKGSISVATQEADASSLLNVYKTWSRLRNTYPALAEGTMSAASGISDTAIAAWYMTSGSEKLLVIHNVSKVKKTISISDKMDAPVALLGTASVSGDKLTIGPNSSVVFVQ